jgi:CRP/FNR family transcriptional regulator, cyclic AMP receptor protein
MASVLETYFPFCSPNKAAHFMLKDANVSPACCDVPAELNKMFVAHLLQRNIRFQADLVDQLFNSSEKRLAGLLLLLSHFGKEGIPQTVLPKISQETLAEMIGTTRSRVSFFMNRFRKLGFVDYDAGDELQVHSSLLSVILHD